MPILRRMTNCRRCRMNFCSMRMKKTKACNSLSKMYCRTNFSLTTTGKAYSSLSMKTRKNCSSANNSVSARMTNRPTRKNSLCHGIRISDRSFPKDVWTGQWRNCCR